jgi:uncharacterized ferritin-like protein (DUF455 family)
MKRSSAEAYLPGGQARAGLMRMESAAILKRFFFCEEAIIRGQAGWLPRIASLDLKLLLPRHIWEDAKTADDLRTRVLELRYPNRLLEVGDDAPLVDLFEAARHAPSALAYLRSLTLVLVPALLSAYKYYMAAADDLGDGPSMRFLGLAIMEKERQLDELAALVKAIFAQADPSEQTAAVSWAAALATRLDLLGGVSLGPLPTGEPWQPLEGQTPFTLAQVPARDPRFTVCRFYWPDNVDPTFGYGEGIALQLRSAVSHLNEVWAVETAGAILEVFAPTLGWEFVVDAARWVYDESRHTRMGLTRLTDWGFAPEELPLGSYIYDSARDQDPMYRLGMLFYFETKNIGKKPKRARTFATYGDAASQHDMDFDWADESIHAGYGKRWLTALIAARGLPEGTFEAVQQECDRLVARTVAQATPEEADAIRQVADRLITHATALARARQPAQ